MERLTSHKPDIRHGIEQILNTDKFQVLRNTSKLSDPRL